MTVLEELEGAIQEAAERTGPKVIGLGQGWGQGLRVRNRSEPDRHERTQPAG